MSEWLDGFKNLPPYGLAALAVVLLYAIQSEIRFGARARSHAAGAADRGSTVAVSLASAVPVLGFALAMKAATSSWLPEWFGRATLPGMPVTAWAGVALGSLGLGASTPLARVERGRSGAGR